MKKLCKDFFDSKELLFIGYSHRNEKFCKQVFQALVNSGIKVYPMNNKSSSGFDVKVYKDFSELPKVPKCAYLLINKENTRKIINQLKEHGVERVLFQNNKVFDSAILEECSAKGIETAVACPMMLFGSGFHKIHAFFAGIR